MAPEQQYLDILQKIKDEGVWESVRQVSSIDGQPLRAKTITGERIVLMPEDGFPLTTLRPLGRALYYFIGEMLWILGGGTEVSLLHKYGVHYWDEWVTKEKCDWHGLPVGSFGPTYGEQWRKFRVGHKINISGCRYYGDHLDRDFTLGFQLLPYAVDQIYELFKNIEQKPFDRRLIVTAWHPADVKRLVIRPCHGTFQVRILDGKRLDMIVTQWSADMPVGVPSNLVMYKFLQKLICLKYGFKEGKYTHNFHDCHYYSDQERGVDILLSREPKPYPTVTLHPDLVKVLNLLVDGEPDPLQLPDINPYQMPYATLLERCVELNGYHPHPAIPRELLPVAI